ncbi:hypothetical protein [Parashewanella tropica]|uniref:hypothetical protein n=1 Tax=Parashewanella tropica TaxID=2547970 RepID=UPI00105A8775|nr:hypothetical protein [Parashewanella tropica]
MKIRAVTILAISFLLCGCPPKSLLLKQQDIQRIDVGLYVDGTEKILPSNDEVNEFALEIEALFKRKGFKLANSSESWGLQPLTGHTKNLGFRYPDTNAVYCYVKISKKEFQVECVELEKEPQTNKYATTANDLKAVNETIIALNEIAKIKFAGRSVRIATFDRAEVP